MASSVRTAAIQPYLVSPAEAQSTRTRVAVYIADEIGAASIASWITMSRDMDLVGDTRSRQVADVIISNLDPDLNGTLVPEDSPHRTARLIIAGPPANDVSLVAAATNGAWAYCSLDSPPQELTATVRRVHAGECPLLAEISKQPGAATVIIALLSSAAANEAGSAANLAKLPNPLTEREMEILTAVSNGASSKEIADSLGLTDQTIRNYMTALLQKIGARNRGQAATLALRNGWLDA